MYFTACGDPMAFLTRFSLCFAKSFLMVMHRNNNK